MDTVILASLIALGVGVGLTILILVAKIAGKDIYYAFKRWLFPQGCEVYVASDSRNITHQYMVPKDNKFKISGETYITNPEKVMNLNSQVRSEVKDSIKLKEKRLKKRLNKVQEKIKGLEEKLDKTEDNRQVQYLKNNIENLKNAKSNIKNKLRNKQENYFKDKRPAFFYIKGDPVPKDFYEFYSTLDSQILDNIVSRAISKPISQDANKKLDTQRWIIIGGAIAAAVSAFLAFRILTLMQEVCSKVGASCNVI